MIFFISLDVRLFFGRIVSIAIRTPIATHGVAWSVARCVGYVCEPYKNRSIEMPFVVWVVTRVDRRNHYIRWERRLPQGKRAILKILIVQ